MLIWALKYWKYLAIIAVILGVIWCVYGYGNAQYKKGYASCMVDVQAAKDAANERTIKKQKVIWKDTEKRKEKFHDQKDDNYVGYLLQRYYDGLRRSD